MSPAVATAETADRKPRTIEYHLRDIDARVWALFLKRAHRNGHTAKFVLHRLAERYALEGDEADRLTRRK